MRSIALSLGSITVNVLKIMLYTDIKSTNTRTGDNILMDRKFKTCNFEKLISVLCHGRLSENKYHITVLKFCKKHSTVRHLTMKYEISCKVGMLKLRGHKFSE